MSAKMAEGGRKARAGQQIRLLDIPADAGKGFGAFDHAGPEGDPGKLADAMKQAARTAYGTAGPAFVRRIVEEDFEEVDRLVTDFVKDFVTSHVPVGADGQVM
jgi:putative DNA primase/helicase